MVSLTDRACCNSASIALRWASALVSRAWRSTYCRLTSLPEIVTVRGFPFLRICVRTSSKRADGTWKGHLPRPHRLTIVRLGLRTGDVATCLVNDRDHVVESGVELAGGDVEHNSRRPLYPRALRSLGQEGDVCRRLLRSIRCHWARRILRRLRSGAG